MVAIFGSPSLRRTRSSNESSFSDVTFFVLSLSKASFIYRLHKLKQKIYNYVFKGFLGLDICLVIKHNRSNVNQIIVLFRKPFMFLNWILFKHLCIKNKLPCVIYININLLDKEIHIVDVFRPKRRRKVSPVRRLKFQHGNVSQRKLCRIDYSLRFRVFSQLRRQTPQSDV